MSLIVLKSSDILRATIFVELLLPLAFYFTNSSLALYLAIPFFILNSFFILQKIKVSVEYIFIFGVVFLGFLFSLTMNNWGFSIQMFSGLVLLLWNFTLSVLILKYNVRKIVLLIFVLFSTYVFFQGLLNKFEPDFGNHILAESSRNYVSAILIIYYISYAALSCIEKEKISILVSVFLFVNCVVLFGRTGIVVSGLLLLYAIYNNYGVKVSVFLSVTLGVLSSVIYYYALEYTNFADGLDTPRTLMMQEYISNISESEIFFGRNFFQCCQTIVAFGPNPHNSFIALHSIYGLYGVFLSILVIIVVLCSRYFSLLFFLMLIYFRYFFDVLGLFYFLDFTIFIIFLYCLDSILKRGEV